MFFIFIEKYYRKKRILHILCAFITVIIILTIRIYILQICPSEKVQSSYQNHQEENITNLKYMILDTNGKDLMKYNKKYVLVIDTRPFSLNNYEETLEDLMALNFIMKGENNNFSYSEIMKQSGKLYYCISEDTYNKINNLTNIKGIYTYITNDVDIKEAWSVSSILSRILDDDHEKESLEDNLYEYLKNNETPKEEFYLDDKAVYAKNSLNISENNKNLKLTIDKEMEEKVREILTSEKYEYLNNIGISILESSTGKIKVMAQKNESEANINLGIQQIGYEPGSIYKAITLATALDMGLVNVNNQYDCRGKICKNIHGSLTIEEAFEKSCNDIFAQVGYKVGFEKLMEYSTEIGLYKRVLNLESTNRNEAIGLMPTEDSGINNVSIGQCMNVTPIQMLGAINAIVNNGVYEKPYIVESILDKNENTIKSFETEEKRVFSETTAKIVKDSMKQVVLKGTGKKANISGLSLGGKTGSATGSDNKTHGWFAGYFNIENKNYTMIVFTPEIESIRGSYNEEVGGGDTAAPIFKDIVNQLNK